MELKQVSACHHGFLPDTLDVIWVDIVGRNRDAGFARYSMNALYLVDNHFLLIGACFAFVRKTRKIKVCHSFLIPAQGLHVYENKELGLSLKVDLQIRVGRGHVRRQLP